MSVMPPPPSPPAAASPPLPSAVEGSSTPLTSPQRHQQTVRGQERSQRHIGSPEQRRTPAIPLHPPSPPPVIAVAENPSTPPTSPQRHQQAGRNQERSLRQIGSPEQRRTPAIPSHPSALPPVIVDGRELNHLPLDLHMQMVNIPPHQPLQRRGHAPLQPLPLPPPPTNIASSSSVAPLALGPGFVPAIPPPIASSSRQTLDPAQLRALYVPPPPPIRSRGRPSVRLIYLL